MKLRLFGLVFLVGLLPLTLSATNVEVSKCDNKSICVNDKNFYVEVKRVSRRGNIVIIQLEYTGKTTSSYYFEFTHNSFSGNATILDAEGNEFKISGKDISDFHIYKGSKKIISLKFRGNKEKKIMEPFDLTIKTYSDEVTLFDLRHEN